MGAFCARHRPAPPPGLPDDRSLWEFGWGSGPVPPRSLTPAEERRRRKAEPDRQQHCGQAIEETVALGGERDEAFESGLANLDCACGDRAHPALPAERGLGTIIANWNTRRQRTERPRGSE